RRRCRRRPAGPTAAGPDASVRARAGYGKGTGVASVRQRVALQAHRVLLQRADAGSLGLLAPGLQLSQALLGIVAARIQQRGKARAVLDQGLDPGPLLHPLLQLLAGIGLEPAAVVDQATAHAPRQ